MAWYYFHVRTARGLYEDEDEDGLDLPHLEAVRREAVVSAHEFLAEAEWSGQLSFEVADAWGNTVLILPIQALSFTWPGLVSPALARGLAALH